MRHIRRHSPARLLLFALLLGLSFTVLLASPPPQAHAASVVGDGSSASCSESALRAAVTSGGAVTFNCGSSPVTIALLSAIEIERDVTIDGGGSITLSGRGVTRLLRILGARVTLSGLTFRDGYADEGGAIVAYGPSDLSIDSCRFINNSSLDGVEENGGGAISVNLSKLYVRDSYFEGNRGINGGAIYSLGGALTIENSSFIGNDSTRGGVASGSFDGRFGAGGAVYTDGASYPKNTPTGGEIIIRGSYFRANRASGAGGAAFTYVYPPADRVLIEDSIFEENETLLSALGAGGGGALRHGNGPLTLRRSTFVGNRAARSGGAFWASRADATVIENVTFAGNEVHSDNRRGQGGALYLSSGSYTLRNTTIAHNYADYFAGAIFAEGDNVRMDNTIVAHNRANDGARWNQCGRTFSNGSNNIMFPKGGGDKTGDYLCTIGISHADPRLGDAGQYGGPVPTLPVLAGSPAIDAGAGCPSTDARGASHIGLCDLGAFEFGATPPGLSPPEPPTLTSVQISGPTLSAAWIISPGATHYELVVTGGLTGGEHPRTLRVVDSTRRAILGRGTYNVSVRACNYSACSSLSAAQTATISAEAYYTLVPFIRSP